MSEDIPVACCLSDAELRKRVATLLARFKSAVIATEELPDGYVFRVPGDKKWMSVVWEAIVAERECCPFLTFELTAQPNMGPVSVCVTGPPGTKDFLKTILCNSEESSEYSGRVIGIRVVLDSSAASVSSVIRGKSKNS
jgi:hypothetical protein